MDGTLLVGTFPKTSPTLSLCLPGRRVTVSLMDGTLLVSKMSPTLSLCLPGRHVTLTLSLMDGTLLMGMNPTLPTKLLLLVGTPIPQLSLQLTLPRTKPLLLMQLLLSLYLNLPITPLTMEMMYVYIIYMLPLCGHRIVLFSLSCCCCSQIGSNSARTDDLCDDDHIDDIEVCTTVL